MRLEVKAMIYGFIMTILLTTTNVLLSNVFSVDIEILFFADCISLLAMIWYYITMRGK